MAVSNGDILRMSIRFEHENGQDMMNVWFLKVVDRGSTEINAWLDAIADDMVDLYSFWTAVVPDEITLKDIKFDKVLWDAAEEKIVIVESFAIIDKVLGGAQAGDPLPSGVAPLIKWRTTGVKTQPKKYLPTLTEVNTADGELNATALTAAGHILDWALADWDVTGGVGGTIRAVVHSLRDASWLEFISGIVETVVAYQRRRRAGVGS